MVWVLIQLQEKKCRNGCNKEENAYHVISACVTPEYTSRHDCIVYWVIKTILQATQAPEDIQSQLR